MSTRERWIVYPLLFLALGAVLRDKILGEIEIPGAVKCGALFVMGPNGQPAVWAFASPQLGNSGIIETRSPNGAPLVLIDATRLGNGVAGQMLVLGDLGNGVRAPLVQVSPLGFGIIPPRGMMPGHEPAHAPATTKSKPPEQSPSGAQKKPGKPNPNPPVPSRVK